MDKGACDVPPFLMKRAAPMVRHQVMDPEDITKLTEEKFRRTNLQQLPAEHVGALTLPLDVTGGKDQCTRLVHRKYIARKWTVYHACAHPVHHKYFQNFPCWFPHDVPSQETASTFTVFQVM